MDPKRLLLSLILVLCTPVVGQAHLLSACGIYQSPVAKLSEGLKLANGLFEELYDTNGDGKPDVWTYSHTDGDEHDPHPVFFAVDLDNDQEPDKMYIDKVGQGQCGDIVLYEDWTMPHDWGLNFSEQTQGNKGREI